MAFDWNYHNSFNDCRVTNARYQSEIDAGVDLRKMTFTFEVDDGEGDEPTSYVLPVKMEVCPTCQGRGTHVNPSIDAGGITEDSDIWDDVDEYGENNYLSGRYDVTCYTCKGRNVVASIDRKGADKKVLKIWEEMEREEGEYQATCRAERLMGA